MRKMVSMLSELGKDLVLPNHLRKELRKVYGEVVEEKDIKKKIRGKFVVCVGDMVANTLLKEGLEPDIIIVDYRTMRRDIDFHNIRNFGDEVMRVVNPPGKITVSLWNGVKRAMKMKKKVRIEVDGEEDLAVIPVVHFIPLGGIVIYGMPNTGLVILEVGEDNKRHAERIIKEMEV